jgi:hypothetical protein
MPIPTCWPATCCALADYALIMRALVATRRDLVPEHWHQGALAIDLHGRETEPDAPESVAWCVQGLLLDHLHDATNATIRAAMHLLHRTASRLSEGRHDTLFAFNDAATTTFADIDRLLRAAVSEATALAIEVQTDEKRGHPRAACTRSRRLAVQDRVDEALHGTSRPGLAATSAPQAQRRDCNGSPVPTK